MMKNVSHCSGKISIVCIAFADCNFKQFTIDLSIILYLKKCLGNKHCTFLNFKPQGALGIPIGICFLDGSFAKQYDIPQS